MNAKILSLLTWEDVQEIYEAADCATTYAEALAELREKYQCKPPSVERYEIVLRAAEFATDRKLSSERTEENTLIRCFISYQMRQEGYTYYEIAKLMHRNHSSVISHVKRMENMLSVPEAYKKEMAMWNEFQQTLSLS